MSGVETFWVSDIHPGEPTEDGKATMLECVRAEDYAAMAEHNAMVEMRYEEAVALLSRWHVCHADDLTDMDELFDVAKRTAGFLKLVRPPVDQPGGGQ